MKSFKIFPPLLLLRKWKHLDSSGLKLCRMSLVLVELERVREAERMMLFSLMLSPLLDVETCSPEVKLMNADKQ